jgi:hypothetical protein
MCTPPSRARARVHAPSSRRLRRARLLSINITTKGKEMVSRRLTKMMRVIGVL